MSTRIIPSTAANKWLGGFKKSESLLEYHSTNHSNNNKFGSDRSMDSNILPPPPPELPSPNLSNRDTSSPLPPPPFPSMPSTPVTLSPQTEPPTPLPPKKTKSRENLTQIHGTVPIRKKLAPLTTDTNPKAITTSLDDLLSDSSPRRRPLRSVGSPAAPTNPLLRLRDNGKSASMDFDVRVEDAKTPLTETSARILRHSSERKPAPAKPPRESLRRSKLRQEQLSRSRDHISSQTHIPTTSRMPLHVQTPTVPAVNGSASPLHRPIRPNSFLQLKHEYEELPNRSRYSGHMNPNSETSAFIPNSQHEFMMPHDKLLHPGNYYPPSTNPNYPPYAEAKLPNKRSSSCHWCVILGMIISTATALTAIALVCLLFFGIISPLHENDGAMDEFLNNQEIQRKQIQVLQEQVFFLRNNSENSNNLYSNLQDAKNELMNEIKKQNFTNVMPDPFIDSELCSYHTYTIGSSSKQVVTNSGEYYAEQGSVITGVTCGTSDGYVSTLRSRVEEHGEDIRDVYWCSCQRISQAEPSQRRIECRIHYWQCGS